MPRSFTVRERVEIYDRLLTHGRALIAGGGFKRASVAAIAEAAGISKGGFYLFFASKEELLVEILERFERQLLNELQVLIEKKKPLVHLLRFVATKWQSENLLTKLTPDELLALQHNWKLERFQRLLDVDLRVAAVLLTGFFKRNPPSQVSEQELASLLRVLFTVFRDEADLGEEAAYARETLVELIAQKITSRGH